MLRLGEGIAAEQDGELVAAGLLWCYGSTHASLGMVGVSPALQGQGVGRAVMQRLLELAGARGVGLYATAAGETLYCSLGFTTIGKVRQLQGVTSASRPEPLAESERFRLAERSDFAVVAALDRQASGLDRTELINALLEVGRAVVLDRDGGGIGFAVIRPFGLGQVIGPVVGPDEAGARALIGHFLDSHPGQFIRLDVPEECGLVSWLMGLGLADAGPALHMVRPPVPRAAGPARRFALVSQSFG
jgi:predicted N-acetyltransferase YhbS